MTMALPRRVPNALRLANTRYSLRAYSALLLAAASMRVMLSYRCALPLSSSAAMNLLQRST